MPIRDRRNLGRVLGALFGWAVCFTATAQLIKRGFMTPGFGSWLAAALPTAVGLFVLLAYARFLREADELQRQIQLEALAIGFGATFFAMAGYSLYERLGAPVAGVADFTVVMGVFYALGGYVGWSRYR